MENLKLDLKTVIGLMIYIASLLGVYYTMKSNVDELQKQVKELKDQSREHSPLLMDFKLQEIQKQLEQVNEKTDRITSLLSK